MGWSESILMSLNFAHCSTSILDWQFTVQLLSRFISDDSSGEATELTLPDVYTCRAIAAQRQHTLSMKITT